MKNNMNSKLTLANGDLEINFLPDTDFERDYVSLYVVNEKGRWISFTDDDPDEPGYFHLDKHQVGCLIDYLKRIHEEMEITID